MLQMWKIWSHQKELTQSQKPSVLDQQIKEKEEKILVAEENNVSLLAEHTALTSKTEKIEKWIIDAEANSRICGSKESFVALRKIDSMNVTHGD